MSSNPQNPAHVWLPPAKADIIAGFQNAFQERPEVVTLTVILKLLTQRGTEALFATTQQRYTNMLHEVTVRFFDDLERMDTSETPLRLIDAVIGLVTPSANLSEKHQALLAQLRHALLVLQEGTQGTNFVQAIIKAATAEDAQYEPHNAWGLLRHFLEQ